MDLPTYLHVQEETQVHYPKQTPMSHRVDPIPQQQASENQRYHVRTFQLNCQAELVLLLDCFKWRESQQNYVVRPQDVRAFVEKEGILQLRVLVQKNWELLSEMGKTSFLIGLGILIGALKGFSILHNKFGNFGIRDSMICVSHSRQVRVWINRDFTKNNAEFQCSYEDSSPGQMVRQLFRQVQPHIQTHLLLAKLKNIFKVSKSFSDTILSLERFLAQCSLPGNRIREYTLSERKYFCKDFKSQDRVKTFHGMTESNLPGRSVTAKNLLQKPTCLVFRQQHKQNRPQNLNKKEVAWKGVSNTLPIRQERESRHVLPKVTVNFCPKSESALQFQNSTNVVIRFGSEGQNSPALSTLCSGYGFPLQTQEHLSRKSGFGPQPTLGSYSFKSNSSRKRTGSVSYNSPPPFSYQRLKSSNQLGFSGLLNTAAKSSASIKKDNLTLFNSNNERTNNRSKSPNYQSSQTLSSYIPRSKRTSIALEFLNIKKLNQSIIQGQMVQKQRPDLIGKLKHSLFNRKDDLKHSEIIMQTNSELSIQETQQEGQQAATSQNASILNTMSLKPMAQSIIMYSTSPNQELPIQLANQCDGLSADLTTLQQPLIRGYSQQKSVDQKVF